MKPAQAKRLTAAIRQQLKRDRADLVEFPSDLIRIPSENRARREPGRTDAGHLGREQTLRRIGRHPHRAPGDLADEQREQRPPLDVAAIAALVTPSGGATAPPGGG